MVDLDREPLATGEPEHAPRIAAKDLSSDRGPVASVGAGRGFRRACPGPTSVFWAIGRLPSAYGSISKRLGQPLRRQALLIDSSFSRRGLFLAGPADWHSRGVNGENRCVVG
jgi:hypothetical protein